MAETTTTTTASSAQTAADASMQESLDAQAAMNAKSLEYNTAMAALQMALGLSNKIAGR